MKIAMVGSRDLNLRVYAGAILLEVANLEPGTSVLLRKGNTTPINPFEQFVAELASRLGHPVVWCTPEVGKGREATYERDIAMADKCDAMIAFFPPDKVMDGGTGHVVEKAIDANRRVDCYIVEKGAKTWVAGHEPDDRDMTMSEEWARSEATSDWGGS